MGDTFWEGNKGCCCTALGTVSTQVSKQESNSCPGSRMSICTDTGNYSESSPCSPKESCCLMLTKCPRTTIQTHTINNVPSLSYQKRQLPNRTKSTPKRLRSTSLQIFVWAHLVCPNTSIPYLNLRIFYYDSRGIFSRVACMC